MNNTIIQGLPQAENPRIAQFRQIFGDQVVLIPTKWGAKNPLQKGYPEFGIEKMSDPEHLRLLEQNNISILTGPNSGNLISIDFDDDQAYADFCSANPDLCKTTKSSGARGCNLWYWIVGEYPVGITKLLGADGNELGEWRAGGGITVVDGLHPEGILYQIDTTYPVKEIAFADINWPESWAKYPGRTDPFDVLAERYGPPVVEGARSGVQINESFVAGWIVAENEICYANENGRLYAYDEQAGIWLLKSKQDVNRLISSYVARLAGERGLETIHFKKRSVIINSIRSQLEAEAACDFFQTMVPNGWRRIPVRNALLALILPSPEQNATVCIWPHRPSLHLIAKSAVSFVEGAECPRFLRELLDPVLEPDDVQLLQKMFGLVLIGDNELQKILLLEGPGDTGKGVAARILDRVLGTSLVTELRTQHLEGRFETSRYLGKRLLAGRDVPSDFLRSAAAARLKALTGGDRISTENKNANEFSDIHGWFHVVITSNSPLLLRVDDDASAWKRRLVIIPFHNPKIPPAKRIPKFEEQLLRDEGPGILNWMLDGAKIAHTEILEHGTITLTAKQGARITCRVRSSDSVAFFAEECLALVQGKEIRSQQLHEAYKCFCESRGIAPEAERMFLVKIKSEVESRFGGGVRYSENLNGSDTRGRGYRGLVLKSVVAGQHG